ncbi:xanthine dehydrogenase family protein molybdopterin-binding subunit [Formosa sp. PL04]|uniref:xanthine dehydrogenase family protein molybdopterin-binding subunit n=1 Tax=Formosa sp. PL04 TaxID=3081755 RepID=UPI0029826C22|nr:molybdopterin cofactor-binding domain-containing protein [Formosa sp. PL04]MDW5288060.1 molybdopterin cofactor-binding domain-containing protein [Formosa sp. PL04]
MAPIKNISRRGFLKQFGLVSGGLLVASSMYGYNSELKIEGAEDFNPNLFIQLNTDGSLILVCSRSEMGQGIRTSLTSVIADEMDADWDRVSVKQATGNAIYGNQNTDGSKSVRLLYQTMREMGATTKAMLITAAAQYWNVPESECKAENHFIIHSSGKTIGYGALVPIAKTLIAPTNVTLKSPKDFKYIGKTLPSIDVQDFTKGAAIYGLDTRIPNMVFAAIKRSPVTFGTVVTFDKTEALKIAGVLEVIEIPRIAKPFGALGGIVVVAKNTWAAFKGRDALKITWDKGANATYNSEEYLEEISERVQNPGHVEKSIGDINSAFNSAASTFEATYNLPHLVHTPMEVPNAIAWVQDNKCDVWAPVQSPQTARKEVANYLDINEENVTINVTLLGGGFGRKAKPDYVVEATMISKAIQKPVQVVWSREDDIQNSYYHTLASQHLKGSLDANGNVTGWLHRFGIQSIASTFKPGTDSPQAWEVGSATQVPFDVPNMQIESVKVDAYIRIGWLRSVINIPHGYAINVFADELAFKANKDPLEFRLNLIGNDRIQDTKDPYKYETAKLKHVLKTAAKNANYGKPLPEGHAIGLAVHYSFYSYAAAAIEVSVVDDKVIVHNVNMVIDCGTAINKDSIIAQMEGAAIFGLTLAYYGKITTIDGAVTQSNFHDYQLMRMANAPKIQVEIIESDSKPTGVGEPGVPVIAPALVNAIFKATGQRYRNLPLSDYGLV